MAATAQLTMPCSLPAPRAAGRPKAAPGWPNVEIGQRVQAALSPQASPLRVRARYSVGVSPVAALKARLNGPSD